MTNSMLYGWDWVSSIRRPSFQPSNHPWKNASNGLLLRTLRTQERAGDPTKKGAQSSAKPLVLLFAMRPDDANLWFSGLLHFYCDNVNLSERNELDDSAVGLIHPRNYTKTRISSSVICTWTQRISHVHNGC